MLEKGATLSMFVCFLSSLCMQMTSSPSQLTRPSQAYSRSLMMRSTSHFLCRARYTHLHVYLYTYMCLFFTFVLCVFGITWEFCKFSAGVHARDEPSDTIKRRPGLVPIPILAWHAITLLASLYMEYVPFTPSHHFEEGLNFDLNVYQAHISCTL